MDMNAERRKILLNTPHLETVSGNIASFYTDVGGVQPKSIKVSFLPKQEGSGTPSPDNIRPISGWDKIEITKSRQNLFDEQYPDIDTAGQIIQYRSVYVGDAIVTASTTCPLDRGGYTVLYLLAGNVTTGADSARNGFSVNHPRTIQSVNGYVTIGYRASTNNADPRLYKTILEYGDTPSAETVTISLPNTFYGGYVDLISGELAVERVAVDFLNPSWFYSTRSGTYGYVQFGIDSFSLPISDIDVVQSSIVADRFDFSVTSGRLGKISWYNGKIYGNAPIDQFTTYNTAGVNAWKEEYKPIITIGLKNPICYKLAPQVIKTLRGINSIRSDVGEVEVTYWTH